MADIAKMKNLGSMWGSWRTWRACSTDNVICHEFSKAEELLQRNFQMTCNFYLPNDSYIALNRPDNVRLYEGKFVDNIVQSDEIVAMHLAASTSDILLLLGFDWREQEKSPDKLIEHRRQVYKLLVKNVVKDNPQTQWVLVDHPGELDPDLASLENLTKDTMAVALSLLNG
jgi:hypothetical protein